MCLSMMTDVNFPVSVILPASGSGERFGCDTPKQFNLLLEQPLVIHTLSAFHRIPWVCDIIVPVNTKFKNYVEDLVRSHRLTKVKVIVGCLSRHRSIHAGVKAVNKGDERHVVIIQDVVRVFADQDIIKQVAIAAKQHGASGVYRPLVSTVIAVDGDEFLQESLDRSVYRASEMPQGFLYDVINTAYQQATDFDFDYGTECLLLAMKYSGTKAKMIAGPENLWKVTYKKDIYAAEGMLKEQHLCVCIIADEAKPCLEEAIQARCKEKNIQVVAEGDEEFENKCNNFVFLYTQFDREKMWTNTARGNVCHGSGVRVTPGVVHVYQGEQLSSDDIWSFMDTCLDIADKMKDVPVNVYGIIDKTSGSSTRVADMVASTLWNGDNNLNGQTFIIKR